MFNISSLLLSKRVTAVEENDTLPYFSIFAVRQLNDFCHCLNYGHLISQANHMSAIK